VKGKDRDNEETIIKLSYGNEIAKSCSKGKRVSVSQL
jgi:hypothetical protein